MYLTKTKLMALMGLLALCLAGPAANAFEVTGELIDWNGCFVLNDHAHNIYLLSDYGSFVEGDWVTVEGELTGQTSPCGWTAEHIDVSSIVASPALSCCSGLIDMNPNQDPAGSIDLSDLICVVDALFSGGNCCIAEADWNCDGYTDLSDLIRWVNELFGNFIFSPHCPCVDLLH